MSVLKTAILFLLGLSVVSCLFQAGNAQIWNPLETVPKPNSQSTDNESERNGTGEGVNESESSINRQTTTNLLKDTMTMKEQTNNRTGTNITSNDTEMIENSLSKLDKPTLGAV